MNQKLIEFSNQTPKLKLDKRDHTFYKGGTFLLGELLSNQAVDLPHLPAGGGYNKDGRYYTLPFLDDDMLANVGNKYDLLVIYEVKNHARYCPIRIELEIKDANDPKDFVVNVCDQRGERTVKRQLAARTNGAFTTQYADLDALTLSKLFD